MQESGVLGGLGGPEVFILFGGIPLFILWKFYQVLAGIKDNLAGIRRHLESTTSPGNGR